MPSTISLANKLQSDFTAYTFKASDEFRWSPQENIIFYDQNSDDIASLLHELAHAALGHASFTKDITLIEMERDAWQYAITKLAPAYALTINDETVQDSLDTYRDWLHARSTCPHCKATGVQTKKNIYKCILCATKWRVNDARICALRRHIL
ncbi:MAG TPA: ImmA/IrrE family metallo-endopeptidase [Candidatus Saccharimonadales bacterium]|jgi:hypothetical protein|nr:ImmA/IrrE family metallo-endopeptidase [Candidatus Saccharimonadales bacterium]